mgnify:CR=1 FL=1
MPVVLDKISEIRNRVDKIKIDLEKHLQKIDVEITPPQPNKPIESGDGGFVESHDLYPRLLTLIYILETDFDLTLQDDIKIDEGIVLPHRYRNEPYTRVEIDSLNRVVYICDEVDNVSYFFDTEELAKHKVSIESLDTMDKNQKKRSY